MAHDPILAQEITNGHAARMRYSRFRAAMLGLEPQRRNRKDTNKSKVTKTKKEGKNKKLEARVEEKVEVRGQAAVIKPDPSAAEEKTVKDESKASVSPKVKREPLSTSSDSSDPATLPSNTALGGFACKSSTPLLPPVSQPDFYAQPHSRLLTPCSESDMLTAPQGFGASPGGEIIHPDPSFDFPAVHTLGHDPIAWHQGHTYPNFGVGFDLEAYTTPFYNYQHNHHLAHGPALPASFPGIEGNHSVMKQEGWDAQHNYQR